ncbi:LysR family transcriptional regulator [Xanthomonas hortorum pv. vitians]|uniref:HTH-type transcriptional regulator DmlR n=1 Tax=Xanthomonas hortorum pv. vitians TaxID=83224 RepID=A0A6V7CK08_9XANT|nr:LysR family transcriptional regulator [Xanthomonas hortorum]APP86585.1 LysR family transcriptional regulator [Xanthomonas hortorum pv. gardneri]ASW46721.1 LysR family transcriptional regulator [Xanthomonas hortorum]MCC8493373.1 LysR family transcriptional regulator [Xanthomonas hortorum pv. gardneri]MCE4279470.1 LysR family transcriptional regulator [Xanthomonas hortorum pv. vitians]MCE4285692.1 LysR family transcriptional regulator [Xanthomonas hortorum pv. vitians]
MDTLDAMRVFTAVAERSGFSAAADALDRSTASVTRQVAALEQRLGTRLLNRTTRRVSLTSAGTAYYQRCLQLLADLDDLEATVGAQALEPAGVLRVNAPVSYGIERLAALLPGFRARYPQVELDLSLSDRLVDMVEEGFDVAIRITRQPAPTLIARQLGKVRLLTCAAPAYLARAGTPSHPSDLAGHECLLYHYSPNGDEVRLHGPDGDTTVRIHGGLRANNGHVLSAAAVAGQGIAMQPDFLADDHLAAGRLVRILPEYELADIGIFAVYTSRSHLAPKVRSFIDYLVETMGECAPGLAASATVRPGSGH